MKQIWTRLMTTADIPLFVEYMKHGSENLLNLFDPTIMDYPLTKVLVAYNTEGPLLFMPLQPVMSMESLAPKPGLSPREEALALREIAKATVLMASQAQVKEVLFLCADENVITLAAAHGFEEVPVKVLRLKLHTTEGK